MDRFNPPPKTNGALASHLPFLSKWNKHRCSAFSHTSCCRPDTDEEEGEDDEDDDVSGIPGRLTNEGTWFSSCVNAYTTLTFICVCVRIS